MQPQSQEPVSPYPHVNYYSPAFAAPPAAYYPLSHSPMSGQQPQQPGEQLAAVAPSEQSIDNCCDICCPGCSVCLPGCGNCQQCNPCCVSCCSRCAGCSPGGCFTATGCSPTQCSGWVGAWSASVGMHWLSFVLLLTAVCVPDWFTYRGSNGYTVGLWSFCQRGYWYSSCGSLDYKTLLAVSNLDLFQSLRAFAIMSLVFATVSAILSSVRLARYQRQQAMSSRFEWAMHGVGVSSLLCLLLTLITSIVAWQSFSPSYSTGGGGPGSGFALLVTAFGLQLLAVSVHAVTLLRFKRAALRTSSGAEGADRAIVPLMEQQHQPAGGEVIVLPAAASPSPLPYASSFQHPAPYTPYMPPQSVGYQPQMVSASHSSTTSTRTPRW